MWWTLQNLSKPRTTSSGQTWHFRVWHDDVNGVYTQRLFFWNDTKSEMGMLELSGAKACHISRLKQMIAKLVRQPAYRAKFHRKLKFPVERTYASYVRLA